MHALTVALRISLSIFWNVSLNASAWRWHKESKPSRCAKQSPPQRTSQSGAKTASASTARNPAPRRRRFAPSTFAVSDGAPSTPRSGTCADSTTCIRSAAISAALGPLCPSYTAKKARWQPSGGIAARGSDATAVDLSSIPSRGPCSCLTP